jgi:hypothetical protein
VIQEGIFDRAVEAHDPDMFVGLESVDEFLKLPDHFSITLIGGLSIVTR